MAIQYKIHPSIGIARLGNSKEYYMAPDFIGELPTEPTDKKTPGAKVKEFKDPEGKIKRQAALFRIFAYDDSNPNDKGTEVFIGDNKITDIQWTAHLANKKAIWYDFYQLNGENGNYNDIRKRNADLTSSRRIDLIIDPGPQSVNNDETNASFSKDSSSTYPQTFPKQLYANGKKITLDTLGSISMDSLGRLTLLGGFGVSGTTVKPGLPPKNYANNDNWYDDICDGPVKATLTVNDEEVTAEPAWVNVAPPRYVPQLDSMITLNDVLFDLNVRNTKGFRPDIYDFETKKFKEDYKPDFKTEILPLLKRPGDCLWVATEEIGRRPDVDGNFDKTHIKKWMHDFDFSELGDPSTSQQRREKIFTSMREPVPHDPNQKDPVTDPCSEMQQPTNENGRLLMPAMNGDNALSNYNISKFLALTMTQYFFMEQWSNGKFANPGKIEPLGPGDLLDRGSLDNGNGGAFSPGIEFGWISRNPRIYSSPYRIRVKDKFPEPLSGTPVDDKVDFFEGMEPGDLTKRMAVPWQADFDECSANPTSVANPGRNLPDTDTPVYWMIWWPIQRPGAIFTKKDKDGEELWARMQDGATSDFGHLGMVVNWPELGFVINQDTTKQDFVEVERGKKFTPIKDDVYPAK